MRLELRQEEEVLASGEMPLESSLLEMVRELISEGEDVAGHGGGRKLSCIDGINTTIYYRKKFPR